MKCVTGRPIPDHHLFELILSRENMNGSGNGYKPIRALQASMT